MSSFGQDIPSGKLDLQMVENLFDECKTHVQQLDMLPTQLETIDKKINMMVRILALLGRMIEELHERTMTEEMKADYTLRYGGLRQPRRLW